MKSICFLCVLGILSTLAVGRAQQKPAASPLDAIKALAGTWVLQTDGEHTKSGQTIEFKVTAAGSAVVETMFPGSPTEMVNLYHMDGEKLMVTHYCAQGVQPRMRADEVKDGSVKFQFVDCTNLKSRDDPHMDSLELTINADKLVEKWSFYADGKVSNHAVFELKRKG
jgi:hypothetical protein